MTTRQTTARETEADNASDSLTSAEHLFNWRKTGGPREPGRRALGRGVSWRRSGLSVTPLTTGKELIRMAEVNAAWFKAHNKDKTQNYANLEKALKNYNDQMMKPEKGQAAKGA